MSMVVFYNSDTAKILAEYDPVQSPEENQATLELLSYEKECEVKYFIIDNESESDSIVHLSSPIEKFVIFNWIHNHHQYLKVYEPENLCIKELYRVPKKGEIIDAFSASAFVQVWDLARKKETHRDKCLDMGIRQFAHISWSIINKG